MKKFLLTIAVVAVSLSSVGIADAQTAPDNTKMNKAPTNSTSSTSVADAQSNSSSDIALTQKIRQSVIADKKLSAYAHNVKIVSVKGAVTLNGVVKSEQEKAQVYSKAAGIAGEGNVTNDLTVQNN